MAEQQHVIQKIISRWVNLKDVGKGTGYNPKEKVLKILECPPKPLPEELNKYVGEIEELIISETDLVEKTIEIIGNMTSLKKLKLEKVSFAGRLLPEWNNLKKINSLELSYISITELPTWISQLDNLEYLYISNTRLKNFPDALLNNLKVLNISTIPLERLPSTNKILILKSVSINNTQISEIPDCYLSQELEIFNIKSSEVQELPVAISELKKLKYINIAGSKIKSFSNEMKSAKSIIGIDMSFTEIEELPEWIAKAKKLKYLGLAGCKLKSLNREVVMHLLELKMDFKDEIGGLKPEHNKAYEGIFIKGLKLMDMDVRYFKNNNQSLIRALLNESKLTPSHEIKIVVLGDKDVGKTSIINHILDMNVGEKYMISAGGLRVVSERADLYEYKSPIKLEQDTHLEIWELSGDSKLQFVHPMFIADENLYLIALDAREEDTLYQRALYWVRFIEKQIADATVLFVLTHAENKAKDLLDVQLIENSTSLRIEGTVCRFFSDQAKLNSEGNDMEKDDEENAIRLRKTLIKVVKELPMYEIRIPSSWKRIKRHTEALLEARNLISYKRFCEICQYYGVENDEKVLIGILQWLCETGAAFIPPKYKFNKNDYIFHVLWFAKGLYSILMYANKEYCSHNNQTRMTIKDLVEELEDETMDSTQVYTTKNILTMLHTAQKQGLCYSETDEFIFPLTRSLMRQNTRIPKLMKDIQQNTKNIHYFIKCPILTTDLLSSIIIKTREEFIRFFKEMKVTMALNELIFIGREGMLISIPTEVKGEENHLMITGTIGCPSEIHMYFSSFKFDERSALYEHLMLLRKYVTIALQAFDEAIKELTGAETLKFEKYIEQQQGDLKTFISIEEIEGNLSAGIAKYYNPKLKKEINLYELAYQYLPQSK